MGGCTGDERRRPAGLLHTGYVGHRVIDRRFYDSPAVARDGGVDFDTAERPTPGPPEARPAHDEVAEERTSSYSSSSLLAHSSHVGIAGGSTEGAAKSSRITAATSSGPAPLGTDRTLG